MPLIQYLRLVDVMARMSLRADATKFILGYIWWLLEPLLFVLLFFLVFSVILGTRQPDFLMFLMTAKLNFMWFSKSVTQSATSIVAAKGLVGRINVPKSIFPMAVVQECLYKQLVVFGFLVLVLLFAGYSISWTWLYLLPLVLINLVMIMACALVASCMVTLVRDFAPLIALGMLFLMFTSGIFFNIRDIGDPYKTELLLAVNPVAFILDAYRQILLYDTPPDMLHLLTIGSAFGALFCVTVLLMRRGSQFLALKALTA